MTNNCTAEEPVAFLVKQKGSKGTRNSNTGKGNGDSSGGKWKKSGSPVGSTTKRGITSTTDHPRNKRRPDRAQGDRTPAFKSIQAVVDDVEEKRIAEGVCVLRPFVTYKTGIPTGLDPLV